MSATAANRRESNQTAKNFQPGMRVTNGCRAGPVVATDNRRVYRLLRTKLQILHNLTETCQYIFS